MLETDEILLGLLVLRLLKHLGFDATLAGVLAERGVLDARILRLVAVSLARLGDEPVDNPILRFALRRTHRRIAHSMGRRERPATERMRLLDRIVGARSRV